MPVGIGASLDNATVMLAGRSVAQEPQVAAARATAATEANRAILRW
jgi:hypothetical protein